MIKGPERRTYYDMNPWYSKNLENGINDWHQHVIAADEVLLKKVNTIIKHLCPESVLEVGCGGGDFTLKYSTDEIKKHIAFEYSSVAVDMAKSKYNPHQVDFREGDAIVFENYKDGSFDLIIAKDVLHCIVGDDRAKFLNNLKSSIEQDGMIILTTHVGLPQNEDVKKYIDLETRQNHLGTRVYPEKVDIEEELKITGLKVIESQALDGQLQMYVLKQGGFV